MGGAINGYFVSSVNGNMAYLFESQRINYDANKYNILHNNNIVYFFLHKDSPVTRTATYITFAVSSSKVL